MDLDEVFAGLKRIPHQEASPFLTSRIAANAAAAPRRARTPRLMTIYWVALAFVVGSTLLSSWVGVAVIVAGIAVLAMPAQSLRLLLHVVAPLLR